MAVPESDHSPLHTQAEDPSPERRKFEGWRSLLVYAGILALFYFGHVEIQTFLGERALAKVELDMPSLAVALKQARQEGKPVLLDVSAIWCPSCRRLDSTVLSNPEVKQAIEHRYVFSRVEYESLEGEAVQQRYGVRGFPTLLVLNGNGELIRTLPPSYDPDTFIKLIAH